MKPIERYKLGATPLLEDRLIAILANGVKLKSSLYITIPGNSLNHIWNIIWNSYLTQVFK